MQQFLIFLLKCKEMLTKLNLARRGPRRLREVPAHEAGQGRRRGLLHGLRRGRRVPRALLLRRAA